MKAVSILVPFLLLVAACGDGGSGGPPRIEGRWAGQMFSASSAFCSDGFGVSTGPTFPTRIVTFEITGGAVIDDRVTLRYSRCFYEGRRETNDFIRLAGSASNEEGVECANRLELSEIRDGAARMTLIPTTPPAPNPDGSLVCVIVEAGEIRRDRGEGELLVDDAQRRHLGTLERPDFEMPLPEGVKKTYGFTLEELPMPAALEVDLFEVTAPGARIVLNDEVIFESPPGPGSGTVTIELPRTRFRFGGNLLTVESLGDDFEYENLRLLGRFFVE